MNTANNTILITGGTSGIGRALAEAFHAKHNKVIIAGRRQQLLDEITKQHPGMVGLPLDVADQDSIKSLASEVRERYPELNVLINNAGVSRTEDYNADDVDITSAALILQTNVLSNIRMTAALLPLLRSQPKATLITTSSGTGFVPMAAYPTYSASKAFLHIWLDTLRFQLRETNVEVLELVPPYVQTELAGPQQATDPNAMPLDAFIKEVIQILETEKLERGEILVEKVKPLRWAEKEGKYDEMLKALGQSEAAPEDHEWRRERMPRNNPALVS